MVDRENFDVGLLVSDHLNVALLSVIRHQLSAVLDWKSWNCEVPNERILQVQAQVLLALAYSYEKSLKAVMHYDKQQQLHMYSKL